MKNSNEQAAKYIVASSIIGTALVVTILLISLLHPEPTPFQYEIYKVVLAISSAGFAALLPGAISAELSNGLKATGAFSVFIVVFFFTPAVLDYHKKINLIDACGEKKVSIFYFDAYAQDAVEVKKKLELAGCDVFRMVPQPNHFNSNPFLNNIRYILFNNETSYELSQSIRSTLCEFGFRDLVRLDKRIFSEDDRNDPFVKLTESSDIILVINTHWIGF